MQEKFGSAQAGIRQKISFAVSIMAKTRIEAIATKKITGKSFGEKFAGNSRKQRKLCHTVNFEILERIDI